MKISTLSNQQSARWRTEAMRSHARPRLIHISKGQGRITIAGLTSGYGPNNVIYLPSDTLYAIEVGPTVFGHLLTLPHHHATDWPDKPSHLRLRDVNQQKDIINHLEAFEKELGSSAPEANTAAELHLRLLAIQFKRYAQTQDQSTRTDTKSAQLVARYTKLIAQHYKKQHNIRHYAQLLDVTPTHLTRCCKQTCGLSALGLLNNRIYYQACTLLRESTLPIKEIAQSLGFKTAAYFTRSFQQKAGVTPRDFRNGA